MASSSFELPKGTRVKNKFHLKPEDAAYWREIKNIRESAYDRFIAAKQRYLDADRILDGLLTKAKWDAGWQEGTFITFDAESGEVLNLEDEKE